MMNGKTIVFNSSFIVPRSAFPLVSPDAEGVRHAVDVVEPGGDERDLKDSFVVETDGTQSRMILARDTRGVARQLHNVIEHRAVCFRERRFGVIILKLPDEIFV